MEERGEGDEYPCAAGRGSVEDAEDWSVGEGVLGGTTGCAA